MAPRNPLTMSSAILKRLEQEKTEYFKKNAGKVDAIPAVFSFLHRD